MHNVLYVEGRGAPQAYVVAKLFQIIDEKLRTETGEGLSKHFDHIISSSTASFPASLIACGKDTEKVFNEVKSKFHEVFSPNKTQYKYIPNVVSEYWNKAGNYFKSFIWDLSVMKRYTLNEFNKLFKDFPEIQIKDTKIPISFLVAKNYGKIESQCFSSNSDNESKDIKLIDAVKASLAERFHFASHDIKSHKYIDHSFISKSALEEGLHCLKKVEKLTDQLFKVVKISFGNLNLKDYIKEGKITNEKLLDIKTSISQDYEKLDDKFLHGNFWHILVAGENGISKDLHKFDKILNEDEIQAIIKDSKICNNLEGKYTCKSFEEGFDEFIQDGLMNNEAFGEAVDKLISDLDNC